MNDHEKSIKNNLTNEQVLTKIEDLQKSPPGYGYICDGVFVSIETSIEQFNHSKDILLQAIENGDFGKLPTDLQNEMSEEIQNIINNSANIDNFIRCQQAVYNSVFTSHLEYRLEDLNIYKDALKKISKLKPAYDEAKEFIDTIAEEVVFIEKVHQDADECLKHIKEKSNTANTDRENISTVKQQVKKYEVETENSLNNIKESEQEIENRKKEVLAFHNNIDKKITDAQTIIDGFDSQRKTVVKLIASAEEALKLSSAVGISAALSAQYEDSKNKTSTLYWISGAVIFVGAAIAGVVWLALSGADSINSIISRIVVVAITISAATFCAKQYTKQNDITENYAYKTVLAKSIVAFADKIEEYGSENSAMFLEGAIQEINRSPAHEDKKEEGITKNHIDMFEKIVNIRKND